MIVITVHYHEEKTLPLDFWVINWALTIHLTHRFEKKPSNIPQPLELISMQVLNLFISKMVMHIHTYTYLQLQLHTLHWWA